MERVTEATEVTDADESLPQEWEPLCTAPGDKPVLGGFWDHGRFVQCVLYWEGNRWFKSTGSGVAGEWFWQHLPEPPTKRYSFVEALRFLLAGAKRIKSSNLIDSIELADGKLFWCGDSGSRFEVHGLLYINGNDWEVVS